MPGPTQAEPRSRALGAGGCGSETARAAGAPESSVACGGHCWPALWEERSLPRCPGRLRMARPRSAAGGGLRRDAGMEGAQLAPVAAVTQGPDGGPEGTGLSKSHLLSPPPRGQTSWPKRCRVGSFWSRTSSFQASVPFLVAPGWPDFRGLVALVWLQPLLLASQIRPLLSRTRVLELRATRSRWSHQGPRLCPQGRLLHAGPRAELPGRRIFGAHCSAQPVGVVGLCP